MKQIVGTSENRRVTFCFMGKSYDGPARFVDIQFHDRGTTIPNASDGVSPPFNAFAVTGRGRHVTDSRPLDEAHKPSILVLLMDEALESAVKLSKRYIPTRQLPDKAVSLIDTAAARVAVSQHAVPARLEDVRRSIETSEIELGILKREARSGSDHGGQACRKAG